jgi:hypothetical protein
MDLLPLWGQSDETRKKYRTTVPWNRETVIISEGFMQMYLGFGTLQYKEFTYTVVYAYSQCWNKQIWQEETLQIYNVSSKPVKFTKLHFFM